MYTRDQPERLTLLLLPALVLADPNQLLGIDNPSYAGMTFSTDKYTTSVIHGLTYALILNPIALAACVVTLITGLLAHCGDLSLVCINGCVSGIASAITFVAVAVNFALFVIAQKRINSIDGAQATLGVALWLALAAWICLVLSSCAFCCGCGGRNRGKRQKKTRDEADNDDDVWKAPSGRAGGAGNNPYAEQMRMEALQAESDRKRLNHKDVPKFAVYETEHIEHLPLKHDYDGNHAYANQPAAGQSAYGGGYPYPNQHPYDANNNNAYIDGVGPGAPRSGSHAVAPATAYYDVDSGMAGYGAHDVTSPAGTEPPYLPQQHHDGYGMAYADGAAGGHHDYFPGSQQHEDMSQYQGYGGSEYGAGQPLPAEGTYGAYAEPAGVGHSQGMSGYEPSFQQGHGGEYGASSYDQHDRGTAASMPASADSPYDAVQQATAAGRSRRLPNVPGRQATMQSEVPYSPSSSLGRKRTVVPGPGGTDGFGLDALQAGGAGGNSSRGGHENSSMQPPGYDNAASHSYDFGDGFGGMDSPNPTCNPFPYEKR